MPHPSQPCLFDLWRAESAPAFHMSEFWPAFAEADIEAFINTGSPRPVATKDLNAEAATHVREVIRRFVAQLKELPEGEYACRQAYLDYEADRLAALDLILADGDQPAISHANDRLYGRFESLYPSEAITQLAYYFRELSPGCRAVAEARNRLLETWGVSDPKPALQPQFEAIEQAQTAVQPFVAERFSFVSSLLQPYPHDQTIPSGVLVDIFNEAIGHILGNRQGQWRSNIKPAAPNIHIDNENHVIVVPADRHYTWDHVRALIIHEIGVHVLRAVNGSHSHERLAGFGLSGYGAFEEAFGVLVGNPPQPGRTRTNDLTPVTIIEFASRPHQPGFREVFEFAADLLLVSANPDESTYAEKSHRYQRAAFSRTIRILKLGHEGFIERSTTKYWRGLNLIAGYLNSQELTPAKFDELLLGKYDPLNPAHLQLITKHE